MNNIEHDSPPFNLGIKLLSLKKLFKEKGLEFKVKDIGFVLEHGYDEFVLSPQFLELENGDIIEIDTVYLHLPELDVCKINTEILQLTGDEIEEMEEKYDYGLKWKRK